MKLAPARQAALRFLAALELDLDGGGAEADWDALQERWLADPLLADPRDRRLFRQLTAGVVRLRGRLDARLRRLTGRESLDPVPRDALRLALYQLEHMDRLPAHAVIGESVEWVKRRRPRLAAWTNAQLRNWQRGGVPGEEPSAADDWEAHAEAVHSIPGWLATRWRDEHGDARALAFMAAVGAAPAYCFRWNALREGREALLDALTAAGAAIESIDGAPLGFRVRGAWPAALREALEDGRVSVQDASSQRIAPLLDARDGAQAPGDYADLCAAPGGKCCHLAERGGDRREVVALDIDAGRLGKVLANAERLGLVRLRAECADLRVAAPRPLDGVLLDAPCSALGTLALNPDARWRRRPEEIPRLAALQRELLVAAAAWVRPGGRLLYAVCTFTPEETVRQREGFLAARPDFAPEPFGADELPAALRSAGGDYLVLPDVEDGSGMYAFRCRRRETPAEGRSAG